MDLANKKQVKGTQVNKEGSTSVKRYRSYKLKPQKKDNRKRFYFWGIVKKVSKDGKAVLVLDGSKEKTSYWMDIDIDGVSFKEGDRCKFEIVISTFPDKDGVYRTKLRIVGFWYLQEDEYEDLLNGFSEGFGLVDVEILVSYKTEIPGMFMLTMRRIIQSEEGEFDDVNQWGEYYYMRYYAVDRRHVDMGRATVSFVLGKTKDLITDKGEVYTDIEERTFVDDDGNTVNVEAAKYVPALAVKKIER